MTAVLALDLATKTGWAAWSPKRELASGAVTLPSTGARVGAFLVAYERWLGVALDEWQPAWVIFEAPILPRETNIHTVRKLCGLANSTETICERREIGCREANNATVRKHFIGVGRGKRAELKKLTMEACKARGWGPRTDDEADALSLLDYAMACLKLPGLPEGPLFIDRGRAA